MAPKVRKVRFEVEKPVTKREEPSRVRKKPAKPAPSTSKTTGQVPNLMEMDLPGPTTKKAATAQRPSKPTATVRSEVHTAPKPVIKKKSARSSAVTEAQIEAATPQKRLVIETPRLEQMMDVAIKAVQNLKAKKEPSLSDPEPYRPTYGPTPKPAKVKGASVISGKGKATTAAESRPSTVATPTLAPIPETSAITSADLSLEEAQNLANELRVGEECSVEQLHVDLELSSDTTEDEGKVKAKAKAKARPASRPKHSDVELSDSDVEGPAQTTEMDAGQSADPTLDVPEILVGFQQSIIISEGEDNTDKQTPSASVSETQPASTAPPASTSAAPPVPSLMSIMPPAPLATDMCIPLRKPCHPMKPHTPVSRLKTELSSPEPLPKVPETIQLVKRRTKKLSNLHLANASLNFRRSSKDIAEDFAVTFQLNPDERHQTQRELAKMRLAQKALCLKLRSAFPVACKSEHSRQAFLEKFDSVTQCVCGHMSDSDDTLDWNTE